VFTAGYRVGVLLAAGLAAAGGVIGWVTLRDPKVGRYSSG